MISCCEFGLNIYLSASKGLESRFFQFSAHPRGWKAAFFSFLLFQGVGKPLFSVFCSSKGLESHFFQFSAYPRGWKAIFSVFCSSEASESHFFQFSVHPRGRKAVFPVFCSSEGSESHFLFFTPSKPKQILNIMLWQSIQYSKVPNSE